MSKLDVVLVSMCGGFVLLVTVVLLLLRRVSSTLRPLPRHYALSLVEPLCDLLFAPTVDTNHYLFALRPNRAERWALARVMARLVCDVVECNPLSVRLLVNVWHLEEVVVWRIEHLWGHRRNEALDVLLRLYPSEGCVRRVVRRTFTSPSSALRQLLLVVYLSPERVVELVARHPYALSWDEVGRIVEVLKMHSAQLSVLNYEGVTEVNVDMLLLRLAAEEGVGVAGDIAQRCAASEEGALRSAAMNVLWAESLFPSPKQSEVEG